jgi:hypothetical protein
MTVIGIRLGHRTTREAEHWLATAPPVPGLVACTHFVSGWVVVTLDGIDPATQPSPTATLPSAAEPRTDGISGDDVRAAEAEHRSRRSGRAVRYPGVDDLVGLMPVAEILSRSAIGKVVTLGLPGRPKADPALLVDTRDFVRPHWIDGVLTLVTMRAAGDRLAPFEVPNPTPCCADHG